MYHYQLWVNRKIGFSACGCGCGCGCMGKVRALCFCPWISVLVLFIWQKGLINPWIRSWWTKQWWVSLILYTFWESCAISCNLTKLASSLVFIQRWGREWRKLYVLSLHVGISRRQHVESSVTAGENSHHQWLDSLFDGAAFNMRNLCYR